MHLTFLLSFTILHMFFLYFPFHNLFLVSVFLSSLSFSVSFSHLSLPPFIVFFFLQWKRAADKDFLGFFMVLTVCGFVEGAKDCGLSDRELFRDGLNNHQSGTLQVRRSDPRSVLAVWGIGGSRTSKLKSWTTRIVRLIGTTCLFVTMHVAAVRFAALLPGHGLGLWCRWAAGQCFCRLASTGGRHCSQWRPVGCRGHSGVVGWGRR